MPGVGRLPMIGAMRAWIVAVGSELLGTDRLDTNSLRLTEGLERHGVDLVGKQVVGDAEEEIAAALRLAMDRAELVLVSGGLGPTSDDRTREGVARALGRGMSEEAGLVEEIRRKFRAIGLDMPAVNRRQAMVIAGAEVLDNRRGTAPGLRLVEGEVTLFLLPGVPAELEHLIDRHLEPWLEMHAVGAEVPVRGSLRIACRSESAVEEALAPIYADLGTDDLTILASPGDIEVRFRTRAGGDRGGERLAALLEEARRLLGSSVYAQGRDARLEEAVGELLAAAGRTVVTAESCTGGGVAERLTSVPGSSSWYVGGVVTYSNRSKELLLEVSPEALRRYGAVSREVAVAMATGARRLLGGDYAVGVTGIAGPSGGTAAKPVGTVHVAVAPPSGVEEEVVHRELVLPGDRQRVRRLSGQWALDMLRRLLLTEGEG